MLGVIAEKGLLQGKTLGIDATTLEANAALRKDLAQLRSNRLEALSGGRKGQCSIRINQQWRICLEWPQGAEGPENVEITRE